MHKTGSAVAWQPRIACVIDVDNMLARRGQFGRYARATLDLFRLRDLLRERGVTEGVAFQNYPFTALGAKVWECLGISAVSTRKNADDAAKLQAINFALDQVDRVIVISGDSDFAEVADAIRGYCKVEVMCLRASASRELMWAADQVTWVDDAVIEPELPLAAEHHANENRPAKRRLAAA